MKRLARAQPLASDPQLHAHLLRDRYGTFRLTRAIRPGPELTIIPQAGYRVESRHRPLPRLAASVSAELLFPVFLDLLAVLGEEVDVHLQSSHQVGRLDYVRRSIDRPVLMSHCVEFEELLLHDGCTGLVVLDTANYREVHFDEHKVLIVYAENWHPFANVLDGYGIPRLDNLGLILEATHYHCSRPEYAAQVRQLAHFLGAETLLGTVWDT
ncbi:hypothetical protein HRbin36_02446 [bacterium HR36]|nr:hypothetical protein HRbin36_02446 [bacterium HR36]